MMAAFRWVPPGVMFLMREKSMHCFAADWESKKDVLQVYFVYHCFLGWVRWCIGWSMFS